MSMIVETERKFVVDRSRLEEIRSMGVIDTKMTEFAYIGLNGDSELSQVRVSRDIANDMSRICIKGPRNGASRLEWQWDINVDEARSLMEFIPHKVRKIRRKIRFDGRIWDIDEYIDRNKPLVIAEIEYDRTVWKRNIVIPDWCLYEVTDDERFYNKELAVNPYSYWADSIEIKKS